MALVDARHCNTLTIPLTKGGTLTLDCSNIFAMTPEDRDFVLGLVEKFEAGPVAAPIHYVHESELGPAAYTAGVLERAGYYPAAPK